MDPCETLVPADQQWDGYTNVKNASCSFCAAVCKVPDINNSVGFFDGFQTSIVVITYGSLLAFTVVWQVYLKFFRQKKVDAEWEEVQLNPSYQGNINRTSDNSKTLSLEQSLRKE